MTWGDVRLGDVSAVREAAAAFARATAVPPTHVEASALP
jgi:hypothetical protein